MWLNEKHIEKQMGHSTLRNITNQSLQSLKNKDKNYKIVVSNHEENL